MECLFLSNNQISRIPKSLYDIGSSLIWLDLQDNSIDLIPEEFCEKFAKLRILDLRNNYLPYLPEKIGELTSLHSLFLSGNIFIEPLPPSIFTLNLTHLYLQGTVMVLLLSRLPSTSHFQSSTSSLFSPFPYSFLLNAHLAILLEL